MALEKVGGHHAGTYEAASEHSHRSAESSAHDHTAATNAGVFNAVAFQSRAGSDEALGVDACVRPRCGCDHGVQLELAAVLESDRFRFEEDGSVSAEMAGGDLRDAAVDFSACGNDNLSVLKN